MTGIWFAVPLSSQMFVHSEWETVILHLTTDRNVASTITASSFYTLSDLSPLFLPPPLQNKILLLALQSEVIFSCS